MVVYGPVTSVAACRLKEASDQLKVSVPPEFEMVNGIGGGTVVLMSANRVTTRVLVTMEFAEYTMPLTV